MNKIGTVASVIKMLRLPDGNTTIIIQGKRRFSLLEMTQSEPYLKAKVEPLNDIVAALKEKEFKSNSRFFKDISLQIIQTLHKF